MGREFDSPAWLNLIALLFSLFSLFSLAPIDSFWHVDSPLLNSYLVHGGGEYRGAGDWSSGGGGGERKEEEKEENKEKRKKENV